MPAANLNNPLVPAFDVVIGGKPLPLAARAHILSVTVDDSVDLPCMFAFELGGSDDQDATTPWADDEALFAIGKAVEIKVGYDDELDSLIKGEITALEPEFVFNRLPSLVVRGYDRRHRLQRGRKTRTFVQQKDSDIASQIASEAGLTAEVKDSQVTHDYVIQANQTDLDFLQQRARRIHFELLVKDNRLLFQPISNDQSAALKLSFSDHLLEFYPRLTTSYQLSEVSVRGWSPKEKKEILSQAKAGDVASKMEGKNSGPRLIESAFGPAIEVVSAQPVMNQAEADQVAKARLNHLALTLIEAEGVAIGHTDLRAGKVIKIESVGKRFGGLYYVVAATHSYHARHGYQTHFTARRNAL